MPVEQQPVDILAALRDLARAAEVQATIAQERQATIAQDRMERQEQRTEDRETMRRIEALVIELQREVDKISVPVVDHYDTMRRQQERDQAASVQWGTLLSTYLTPAHVGRALGWISTTLALVGAGGFVGANFRGCSGAVVTSADSPVQTAENEGTP